ncbi:Formation of crista junctions protein 1 [Puccinia graminis f. sp. tritici]|uniref:Formation of crista junctions protein 1 n=1 Tax=Puccinia graminis f. sp. tritici TaxID=56615 RepID=A0A5B0RX80_PUCGR|nr:Formation of crista junctions protein 1 [Puccinia graminis f. sp. tritici]
MLKLNCKPPRTLKRITNNNLSKYRLYATEINPAQPIKPVKKKGIFRKLILPTTLLGGTLYGAGQYKSQCFQSIDFD